MYDLQPTLPVRVPEALRCVTTNLPSTSAAPNVTHLPSNENLLPRKQGRCGVAMVKLLIQDRSSSNQHIQIEDASTRGALLVHSLAKRLLLLSEPTNNLHREGLVAHVTTCSACAHLVTISRKAL